MSKKKPDTIIKELKKLQPGVEWLPIDEVHQDPANPRIISEEEYEKLKTSIIDFPEMMVIRGQGVIDGANFLLGSNQRHRACKELGWKEFPIIRANGLTAEQLKEFKIKDNLHSGTWDTDELFKDWDLEELKDWNFNMDLLDLRPPELSDISNPKKAAENTKHQKTLHLKYTEKDFLIVKERLAKIAETPEQALWKLLHPEKKK